MKPLSFSSLMRRRELMAGGSAIAMSPFGCDEGGSTVEVERWISAQGDDEDSYGIAIATADGRAMTIESGFRGHGLAVDPVDPRRVVMVGRRPGTFAIVVDLARGSIVQRIETVPQRIFSGHGCFTADGSRFITTEADVETAEGTLGIRDAVTFELIGELPTHGIGPHELAMMPDGATVVVGNGGIVTTPATGSDKLNLDTMRSTLTYVDLASGAMNSEHVVPEAKASIRHLAVAEDGTVVTVMQVQRDVLEDSDPRPLIAVLRPGGPLEVLEDGVEIGTAMHDYAGGVAVDDRTRLAAVTSPRGSLVAFWNIDTGRLEGQVAFDDVSGVTVSPTQRHFIVSGSGGQVRHVDVDTLQDITDARVRFDGVRWDNHMLAVFS